MLMTVRYQLGTYTGVRSVNAETEEEATGKVKRWARQHSTLGMCFESYKVIERKEVGDGGTEDR